MSVAEQAGDTPGTHVQRVREREFFFFRIWAVSRVPSAVLGESFTKGFSNKHRV